MIKKKRFNLRTIKYLALIALAVFIAFKLGFIGNSSKVDESQKSAAELQQLQEDSERAKLEVAMAKEKLKADIQKANNYKSEIDKTFEFVLLTSTGSASKNNDDNPHGYSFMKWGFEKNITVYTDYKSKYILSSNKITSYVEDDALVSLVYRPEDIYVFTELENTSVDENTGIFKSTYSKADLLALQELMHDDIDTYLLEKKENIKSAEDVLKKNLVEIANKYGVSKLRLNGEIIDTKLYIDNLNDES